MGADKGRKTNVKNETAICWLFKKDKSTVLSLDEVF
jgi:hypothetical protein